MFSRMQSVSKTNISDGPYFQRSFNQPLQSKAQLKNRSMQSHKHPYFQTSEDPYLEDYLRKNLSLSPGMNTGSFRNSSQTNSNLQHHMKSKTTTVKTAGEHHDLKAVHLPSIGQQHVPLRFRKLKFRKSMWNPRVWFFWNETKCEVLLRFITKVVL